MKIESLQKKLFTRYVITIVLGFVLFSAALFFLLTFGLHKKLDGTLMTESVWIENFMKKNIKNGEGYISDEIGEHFDPMSVESFAVLFNEKRDIIFRSQNLYTDNFLAETLPMKEPAGTVPEIRSFEIEEGNLHYRVLTKKIILPGGRRYIIRLALRSDDVGVIQKQLLLWLIILIPLVGLPFAFWAKRFAERIARPLVSLSDKAREITIHRLTRRMEIPSFYKEVRNLTGSFNDMIRRLDRSVSAIKRFTSDASHELRTPLSVLKSQIQVALQEKSLSPRFSRVFSAELTEVNRMEKIISSLLTLSRYDSEKIKFEESSVDLADLVIEQSEKMKKSARTRNVNMILGRMDAAKIMGDRIFLTQMINNLLDNAVKYNRGNGRVFVELEASPKTKQCRLIVQDTGIGIPKEDLPHVFDRFYRVDKSRSREVLGSGLGLSLVKLIVKLHGGSITIESQQGEGTTVTVTLPMMTEPQ